MNKSIASLAELVLLGERLDGEQALTLASVRPEHRHDLFYWANRIRLRYVGPNVKCCSIIAAKTGRCSEDCAFCSQSAHYDTHVDGLTTVEEEEVVSAADEAAGNGASSFGIVNSGLGPSDAEIEHWAGAIGRIRESKRIRSCASLGILSDQQAKALYDAGLRRFNHNLQTSRRFFPEIVKTHSYEQRLDTLRHVKNAGLSVCSGGIFGMGETWKDRVDLALQLRELDVDVVPLNFLNPIDGTPLTGSTPLPPIECLHIIALYRFLLPDKEIKIAGGREVNLRDLQSWIFFAGANSFLIGNYLTTLGRSPEQDMQMIADLGLELADGTRGGRTDEPGHQSPRKPSLGVCT